MDNGISPKTGSVTVSIDITDVNDNMPIIQTSSPVIMVKEGIPINSKFAKIDASDSDLGANGKVEFALKENQDTFEIDKDSGQLFTKTEIDREVQDKYELTVVVTDGGSPKSLSTVSKLHKSKISKKKCLISTFLFSFLGENICDQC